MLIFGGINTFESSFFLFLILPKKAQSQTKKMRLLEFQKCDILYFLLDYLHKNTPSILLFRMTDKAFLLMLSTDKAIDRFLNDRCHS